MDGVFSSRVLPCSYVGNHRQGQWHLVLETTGTFLDNSTKGGISYLTLKNPVTFKVESSPEENPSRLSLLGSSRHFTYLSVTRLCSVISAVSLPSFPA